MASVSLHVTIYAIVPVKNLGSSKRRLSAVFTPQERMQLTLAMLEDVLAALKASVVDEVLVVGENSQVQKIAERHGAFYLSTAKNDLNPALEEASDWCIQRGAGAVLVLPADVPFVSTKEINRIVELDVGKCGVVLSPSSNGGTNALLQHPPNLIHTCFGSESFLAHIREAYVRGVSIRLHFSPELATDIDSAEDLRKIFEIENTTECRRALEQIMHNSPKAMEFFIQKN